MKPEDRYFPMKINKKGEKTMAYLKGYVDHIRFRNEDNGYTVLSLDVDGDEETVVGSFPFLNDGEYISCLLYTSPSPRD